MLRYLKYSLALHAALLALLVGWTFLGTRAADQRMRFVILPKGTSLDAVMTREVEEAILNPDVQPGDGGQPTPAPTPDEPAASPTPPPTPEPTPEASPTPIKLATPTPEATLAPLPEPEKTIEVAPRDTPAPTPKPSPTASPKPSPTPTPKPTATPKPTPKVTPKPSPTKKPTPKPTTKPTPKATPKTTPKPTPKQVSSAYDITPGSGTGGNRFADADLPRQTPSNVTAGEARPGQEVGVPGVPEGVEGAPLPLDRNQGMLSMLYTTRARMRIQSNFTVPPGVNDPDMTCVLEWEITPDGTIRNVRVAKSTGVASYDACAIDALNRTTNLGPLPPEFGGKSVWTSLTFVYSGDGSVAPIAQ